ncbi:hypothetical protein CDIK_1644 [Cucumispora dikerogammari]|nr:hypothetical protein CDIK_1644 [Cucumispora dikerogammari]
MKQITNYSPICLYNVARASLMNRIEDDTIFEDSALHLPETFFDYKLSLNEILENSVESISSRYYMQTMDDSDNTFSLINNNEKVNNNSSSTNKKNFVDNTSQNMSVCDLNNETEQHVFGVNNERDFFKEDVSKYNQHHGKMQYHKEFGRLNKEPHKNNISYSLIDRKTYNIIQDHAYCRQENSKTKQFKQNKPYDRNQKTLYKSTKLNPIGKRHDISPYDSTAASASSAEILLSVGSKQAETQSSNSSYVAVGSDYNLSVNASTNFSTNGETTKNTFVDIRKEDISEYKRPTARNKSEYIVLKPILSNNPCNKNIILFQKYNLDFSRSDREPPTLIENITNYETHKSAAYIKVVYIKETKDYI